MPLLLALLSAAAALILSHLFFLLDSLQPHQPFIGHLHFFLVT
jgi:hypothetical protein